MKKVPVGRALESLAKYAEELDDEIVVVTKGRRPLAALVPLKHLDRESLALSSSPAFLRIVERARREITTGKSLSLDEMRAKVSPKASKPRLQRTARARRREPPRR